MGHKIDRLGFIWQIISVKKNLVLSLIITFAVGGDDAAYLAKEYSPTFSADDMIKYYKCRENIFLSRPEKNGEYYEIEVGCNIDDFLHSEVTLMQFIKNFKKKIVKIFYSIDCKRYIEVNFSLYDENESVVMYEIPSKSKKVRISISDE